MAGVPQAQFAPVRSGGLLSQPLSGVRDLPRSDVDYAPRSDANGLMMTLDQNESQTTFDTSMSAKLAAARQAAYDTGAQPKRVNMPMLILLGLILFALFFGIGYYLSTIIIH
ncbi:hypothetical protein [Dictyobacter kobayashii]|uniref:Uncharacterized protein n=1 Tax=Dictyobacter kobayashii TaxID=2014872 RepID=A0A402AI65_9CHLR|nr:hypothetical protein [Dictyobacter kobayashii]GCE18734.1 hypothetical protein KDK_25340 [Dictyobacter kobayashii]